MLDFSFSFSFFEGGGGGLEMYGVYERDDEGVLFQGAKRGKGAWILYFVFSRCAFSFGDLYM